MFKYLGRVLGFKPLDEYKNMEEKFNDENDVKLFSVNPVNMDLRNKASLLDEKLVQAVIDIQKVLIKMCKMFEAKKIHEEHAIKWKHAAIVLDRFFLILTTIYFVITFCALVMSVPNLYKPI